jgi:hypothetical protein
VTGGGGNTGVQVKVDFTGPDITLTGLHDLSQSANESLTVSVSGSFIKYRWVLDGVQLPGETSSLTLYAKNLSPNRHELTVFVTNQGGVEYAKAMRFTVRN